ncbi:MAG TPA: hypothetical protein VK357_08930, partial [Rubrobacteraceae bacterium]|nr:hypothetical protein [Rubrobacteraceae bacterium]
RWRNPPRRTPGSRVCARSSSTPSPEMLVHMIADYGLGDKEAPVLRTFLLLLFTGVRRKGLLGGDAGTG